MYTFLLINLVVCSNCNNTNRVYLPVDYYIWPGNFENSVVKTNDEEHLQGSLEAYLEGRLNENTRKLWERSAKRYWGNRMVSEGLCKVTEVSWKDTIAEKADIESMRKKPFYHTRGSELSPKIMPVELLSAWEWSCETLVNKCVYMNVRENEQHSRWTAMHHFH